ncbi:MAG: PEP-CTERM sorting domain-containing protein [Phycisphaeraceae bacterium]
MGQWICGWTTPRPWLAMAAVFLSVVVGVPCPAIATGVLGTTSEISQYGVTWTFDEPVAYGQFVTGDYWIVPGAGGQVTVTSVSPGATQVNGWQVNGSMVNPPNGRQAYDSRTTHWGPGYHGDHRAEFPLTVGPDSSIVSTVSRQPLGEPLRPALSDAAVLTVLAEAPPTGSFRPGLIGDEKVLYNVSDIRWDRLPGLAPTASTPSEAAVVQSYTSRLQRPWLLHNTGWGHRHIMPENNSPSYHQNVARLLSEAAVLSVTDFGDRTDLVTNYLQVAIDYYTMQRNGHVSGREGAYNYRWPTIFAGIMLGDDEMRDMWLDGTNSTPGYHDDKVYFADEGTKGPASNILDGVDTWTAYSDRTGERAVFYGDGHEELHPDEWGTLIANGSRDETYRRMHSIAMVGFSVAATAFNAEELLANDAYIPYAMRWMWETDQIILDSGDSLRAAHPLQTSRSPFVDEAWHAYVPEPHTGAMLLLLGGLLLRRRRAPA